MNRISGVYKITNTITGEFYIGSSKNMKRRWREHKSPSAWEKRSNNRMYQDMQRFGVDKFKFEIIEETTELKQCEQYWMNLLKPKYNNYNAKGWDIERCKKTHKKYRHQLCVYNGETLTLNALRTRFRRAGIPHPTAEAKKYLEKQ